MRAPIQIDPASLERWQALAKRDPHRYRLRLTIFAVLGDFLLTCAQILPWVLPIVVGVMFFPHPMLVWIGIAAVIFIVWLVRPGLHVEGSRIERRQAPELFRAIDELREKQLAASDLEVYVDGELNAGAAEGRGLFGLLGTRRVMALGVPLLACLSKDELLAVIAHELGHFSRRHGRLGGWLYRARMGWTEYAEREENTRSAFEHAMSWYARIFAPRFLTMSLVHSRDAEYEADADAATVMGHASFAHALTRVAFLNAFFEHELGPLIARWQSELPNAPGDFHARLSAAVRGLDERRTAKLVAKAAATQSSWHDTHPALADRLSALGEVPRLGDAAMCAGQALFGDEWLRVVKQFDDRWARGASIEWRVEHLRVKLLVAPLLSAEASKRASLSTKARLRRARALRRVDPLQGITELRELRAERPDDVAACFALSAALLSENDAAGVEPMESLARAHPAYAEPAYSRLAAYAERVSDVEHLRSWRTRLERASDALHMACDAQVKAIEKRAARVSVLDDVSRAYVEAALRDDACVIRAWLLEGEQPFGAPPAAESRTIYTLIVVIDTEVAERQRVSEVELIGRYHALLRAIVEPYEPIMVRTYYSTEPLPKFLGSYQPIIEATRPNFREEQTPRESARSG